MLILWFVVLIFLIIFLWWLSNYFKDTTDPIIHSQCNSNNSCGSELVCDLISNRCKKALGGDCSTDVDCQTGLYCVNWKCTDNLKSSNENNITINKNKTNKKVQWSDKDTIIYI